MSEASAELLPHRGKYLLIVVDFLRNLLELHFELIERVERELEAEEGQTASGRARAQRKPRFLGLSL